MVGLGELQSASSVEGLEGTQSVLIDLWEGFLYRLPGLAVGIVIMALFIVLAGPFSRLLLKPLTTSSLSPLIKSVTQRTVSLVIMLLGIYLFLFLAGLTGFAVAVISGTGVVGLILGFAFRDIAENFISSLLLTVQRPFRIGDIVQISEFTGIIQKVTSRATTLVDFDGNHIQIPNSTIYKGVIKNLTANPLMRGQFVVGVGYDADIRYAQTLALDIVSSHQEILPDPEPQVLIDNLGPSSFNLKVYFWIDVEKTSVLKMASLLMRKIVTKFDEDGISMPDDARERIFPQGISIVNEPVPASDKSRSEKETSEDRKIRAQSSENDDVSSEAEDIREQATKARDPESGNNIL